MKKFFALLIAAAMLCCIIAVPAAADGAVTFTAPTVNDVNPGDTVEYAIRIDGSDYEAHTIRLHVLYDNNNLTVVSAVAGPVMGVPGGVPLIDSSLPGDVSCGFLGTTSGFTGSGNLVVITFKVAETCTEDQPITLRCDEFNNSPIGGTATPIEFTIVNGSINLKDEVPPTEPPVQPTEPPVQPTEPPVEPTEPAEMSANFAISPKSVEVKNGQEFTVALVISGNYSAHTMNLSVNYDVNALTLVNVAQGDAIANAPADAIFDINSTAVEGSVRLGMIAPSEGFSATGQLLVLTFKAADDFKENYTATNGTLIGVDVAEFDNMPVGAINGVVIPNGADSGAVIPATGAVSLIGLGVAAIAAGAGVVLFRKKED